MRNHNSHLRNFAFVFVIGLVILVAAVALHYFINSRSAKQILYIGRAKHLSQRFNHGYGKISASNCYVGGTITNCRMNKVLLELYEQGKIISLYFYKTRKYKAVEHSLLRTIRTPYNIKDN